MICFYPRQTFFQFNNVVKPKKNQINYGGCGKKMK